ncbi:MAG TPA: alpha/beta fold hydrolase [Candidatus Limnocylindria bacterium]|jgi:pimeloyl-ACP methyl ester carboxylesterase|nr:alpha/beta fold hydrolase [Candidatus Limnocylindria bacterium]
MNGLPEARRKLEAIGAQERADPRIDPRSVTAWWLGEEPAPLVIVLLHGLSNGPLQYAELAPQLAARGHAVLVPRMPFHGYRDRLTTALAAMRASDLEGTALRTLAIAALCGRRVAVAGISLGATLAGWLAARVAVDHAVAVAPFCGARGIPEHVSEALGSMLRAAPNRFAWWDPRRGAAQPPPHAYPRFATRALGESLLVSTTLEAPGASAHARRATLVLNASEPAVSNVCALRRFAALARAGVALEDVVWEGLPPIHDLIEPRIPQARTDLVYPRLIELLES